MNLEKMNLVELNTQELKQVEGGIWPLILLALCLSGCAAAKPCYETYP